MAQFITTSVELVLRLFNTFCFHSLLVLSSSKMGLSLKNYFFGQLSYGHVGGLLSYPRC